MTVTDARIWTIIEAAARAATDEKGHFEQKVFVDGIRDGLRVASLTPDIKAQVEHDQAVTYATRFVNRRKPKPGKDGGLFHPEYVLALGNGERVWMDKATSADLLTWGALEVTNTAVILAASGRRQAYVGERIGVFAKHPKWVLGEVERKSFAWVETEDAPDESEDEDLS